MKSLTDNYRLISLLLTVCNFLENYQVSINGLSEEKKYLPANYLDFN